MISTFVFAAYVTRGVAPDPETGTAWWGGATAAAGLGVALLGPVMGAIADRGGRRKPWLAALSLACIGLTAALWTVMPEPAYLLRAAILVALAGMAFELCQAFYNAMLPEVAPHAKLGRVSGWAWGVGYAGGLSCLAISLAFLVGPETPPFGLDKAAAEPVRATAVLVALWFAVFCLPLFLFVPDPPASGLSAMAAARAGVRQVVRTLRELPARHRPIGRYLLARMFYTDGLNTLFSFGGVYAAGTFGMTFDEILVFGILLNVTAGLGAVGFAWVDDWLGPKPTVLIALVATTVLGLTALVVQDKLWFYVVGCALGTFFGPAQAASRSLMAHLAPAHLRTEMFGLYALSGRITAFAGPALVGWVTYAAGSQRVGMATIIVFLVAGILLLRPLKVPRKAEPPGAG